MTGLHLAVVALAVSVAALLVVVAVDLYKVHRLNKRLDQLQFWIAQAKFTADRLAARFAPDE